MTWGPSQQSCSGLLALGVKLVARRLDYPGAHEDCILPFKAGLKKSPRCTYVGSPKCPLVSFASLSDSRQLPHRVHQLPCCPSLYEACTSSVWIALFCQLTPPGPGQILLGMTSPKQICASNHPAIRKGLNLCHWHPSLLFIPLMKLPDVLIQWAPFQSLELKMFFFFFKMVTPVLSPDA